MEFDIVSGRIRVKPETLMIGELRTIWESDDSSSKSEATDILTYIHIVSQTDQSAPYFSAREDEVRFLASSNVWFRRECPYDLTSFEPYIQAYLKSKEDPEVRILKIFNTKIDQLQDTINKIKPEIKETQDSRGNFKGYATNMTMLTGVMKELNKLLQERDSLQQRIKNEAEKEGTYRAGKRQNRLEKRLLESRQNGQASTDTTQQSGAN